jgi:pyridoxamine 5'-phosphate oxidase
LFLILVLQNLVHKKQHILKTRHICLLFVNTMLNLCHRSLETKTSEMELGEIRNEYRSEGIDRNGLPGSPVELFDRWITEAIGTGEPEPTAMVLSTLGVDGFPDSRVVLLKSTESGGFSFFTNYFSPKSADIRNNQQVSLLFFWRSLYRQVRIKGLARKTTDDVSDEYFASRPEESRIGAWASAQSTELSSREELDEKYRIFKEFFEGKPIPRPEHWGGFIVEPTTIEFWQGRENRLHDRFLYVKNTTGWAIKRLAP